MDYSFNRTPDFYIIGFMEDTQRRIEEIQKEIRETPYHKATEHHIGKLRAKLAKLKDQIIERRSRKGGGGGGFAIKKQGDATVVLVGFPSVGKSTLLNRLTNAASKVAPYVFTTVSVIPGMMGYKGARIQILDVPGLIEGAAVGKGRGREVLSVVRGADLLLVLAEVGREDAFEKIDKELYENGVRINMAPPRVDIIKTQKGGLLARGVPGRDFTLTSVKDVAREFGYANAEITIKEKLTLEEVIDAFTKSRVYTSAVYVINKIDIQGVPRASQAPHVLPAGVKTMAGKQVINDAFPISAENGWGLEELKKAIWEKLGLVRVYLRRPGKGTDYNDPLVLRQGQTLSNALEKIGSELATDKTRAKIWGSGAKFPGQKTSLSTAVLDGMEIMFE